MNTEDIFLHEWDLTRSDFFQVLDNPEGSGAAVVALHIAAPDAQVDRLRRHGVDIPGPVEDRGFRDTSLRSFR